MQNISANSSSKEIEKWVSLFSDELFTWAFYKISDKELAEDLVQETFLAAYQKINSFENKSEPKTWLFSILKNKIADHFRRSYRNGSNTTISFEHFFDENENWIPDQKPQKWEMEDEKHLLDNFEFNQTLKNCLQKLPEKWNASIVYKFIEEKNAEQICQELDISPTNYWQILHRSKLQLRKCLEMNWFKK